MMCFAFSTTSKLSNLHLYYYVPGTDVKASSDRVHPALTALPAVLESD
jgi:hypothetical protein